MFKKRWGSERNKSKCLKKDLNGMKVIVYKTKVNGYQKKDRIETKVIVYKKM